MWKYLKSHAPVYIYLIIFVMFMFAKFVNYVDTSVQRVSITNNFYELELLVEKFTKKYIYIHIYI